MFAVDHWPTPEATRASPTGLLEKRERTKVFINSALSENVGPNDGFDLTTVRAEAPNPMLAEAAAAGSL